MAGDEAGVVAHRPQALGNRIEQLLVIATGEIGAADRSLEQDVADQRQLRFGMVEDDMAGGVGGSVAVVDGELADVDRVAIDEVAVRLERLAVDAFAVVLFI